MINTPTLSELKSKFPYIVPFAKYMDSTEWWTEAQLWRAFSLNAPQNTVSITDTPFENNIIKTLDQLSRNQQLGLLHYQ